jgi:hypothetical protein
LVVQVLPFGLALAGGAEVTVTLARVLGCVLVLVVFIAAGGVVAILVGDAVKPKQAIAYGLGWQGLIGGFLQGIGGPAGRRQRLVP